MQMLQKAREEGLSLKQTFYLMLVVSLGMTAGLLLMTFHTLRSFRALSNATNTYIATEAATDELLSASDYLTEEAQCYCVIGSREHLDRYFIEAEVTCRREKAVESMEQYLPDSEALRELKGAMQESVTLMDSEYYAMRLMLEATGDEAIPEAMAQVRLTPEDERLSAAEKKELAERMLHNDAYYTQKNRIRSHLNLCVEELKNSTHDTQAAMENRVHTDLVWISVLIVLQSLGLVMLLTLTTRLGINPILQAVDHIKQDQSLPIMGAHEFRYLAGTYNKMYAAYKRSIENLSYKASHDELTGVYNRAGYDLIKRSVDPRTTAFLLFDADHFKRINDRQGHEVGDRALIKLADTLRANFRADDYICRIGGDEFVVLMAHVDENSHDLLERKVDQINRDLARTDDGLPPLSVSVGISFCREKEKVQEVFHEADLALYYVKENGKKGCCFYNSGLKRIG